ncbi:LysR family transcriptional regulator [Candidatus Pantoea soli]|uniref:LysR family transcriptional regulator n=1 Tax=Candidatus Pantoea soli TaxID=3098669 RepID=A0A518XIZ5_9GAMM|nr:LysR family transcriptional regulator [Pantoea soli]QDY44158.1 LysR family transcriptional regulator [Pantoea soli]
MTGEDLRYFSTFAQTGSLASAAKKLGVDHATVARRIASLEASVNLRLMDCRPRSCVLTEDGHQIALVGERVNAAACSLQRYSSAGQDAAEGDLAVAAPPAFTGAFIAPHVRSLRKTHPLLRLSLLETKSVFRLTGMKQTLPSAFPEDDSASKSFNGAWFSRHQAAVA